MSLKSSRTVHLSDQSGYSSLEDTLGCHISSSSLTFLLTEMLVAQQVERQVFVLTASVRHFLYRANYSATGLHQETSPDPHNKSSVRGTNCKAVSSRHESPSSVLCGLIITVVMLIFNYMFFIYISFYCTTSLITDYKYTYVTINGL